MFDRIWNIWRKELIDNIRDRKSLQQAILIPIIVGIFYAVFNPMISASFMQRAKEKITIPAQGIQYAGDSLIKTFEAFGITLRPYEGDLREAIRKAELEAGIIIPDGFADKVKSEQAVGIEIVVNSTAGGFFGGNFSTARLELALQAFNQAEVARRLQNRSVDTAILRPITPDIADIATAEQLAGRFAAFGLPLLVSLLVAQGGLYIAIDVTAGEKERGTLEALLVTPASDNEVLFGKLGAVYTLSQISILLTLAGFYIASLLLPFDVTQGNVLPFKVIGIAALISVPLTLFICVVLLILTVRAKAFKDAQSSASLLVFAGMVPSLAAAFILPTNPLAFMIPIYGPAAVVSIAAVDGPIHPAALPLSLLGSLIAVAVGLVIARRLFNRERMLYGA